MTQLVPQSASPAAQVSLQMLAVQTAVALGSVVGHWWPQVPQLAALDSMFTSQPLAGC